MNRIFTYTLITIGLLIPYTTFAMVTLDPTNSLDSAVYASGSGGQLYAHFSGNDYKNVGFQYRPGAGHNICSVTISAGSTNASSTLPALLLSVYNTNSTIPATSTSKFLNDGILVQNADSGFLITNTPAAYTYTFTPCMTVQGGKWYNFAFSTVSYASVYLEGENSNSALTLTFAGTGQFIFGSGLTSKSGSAAWSSPYNTCTYGSNYLCAQFVINGVENYSNFVASSTTSYSSVNCTPPDNILDIGGGMSYALCYMFVPNPDLLSQYANLQTLINTKLPFTYLSGLNDIYTAIYTESGSTTPDAKITYPLNAISTNLQTGSTSSTFTFFSPSQITADVPLISTLRTALGYIIYLTFGLSVYKLIIGLI